MVSSRCQGIKGPGSRPFKRRLEAKGEILGGLSANRRLSGFHAGISPLKSASSYNSQTPIMMTHLVPDQCDR
jgi:hypothetical protein